MAHHQLEIERRQVIGLLRQNLQLLRRQALAVHSGVDLERDCRPVRQRRRPDGAAADLFETIEHGGQIILGQGGS